MYCCRLLRISWLVTGYTRQPVDSTRCPKCNSGVTLHCDGKTLEEKSCLASVSRGTRQSATASSVMNARPSLLMGPRVSTAIGTTVYVLSSSAYFECFLVAAFSAALPASI